MTDKVTIQPKSKPEKTTISISGETSERLEIYCRANGILRKEFVSLALEYFERTGFDLKSNALDYSPLEKIIGELKIPGFSDYLHPYGDGKLLGIGLSVDEEGMTTEGVKLSMFDISDPANVKEMSTYVLENVLSTDAGYNYKAVFADAEKNLFGFMAYGDSIEYKMFTYDEAEGFKEVFSKDIVNYGNVRGLYIGETFYLVAGNTVESFTLNGFEKIDDLVL